MTKPVEKLVMAIYKGWDENEPIRDTFIVQDVLGILSSIGKSDATFIHITSYLGTQEEKVDAIKEVLSAFGDNENVAIATCAYVSMTEFGTDKYYDQNSYNTEYIDRSIKAGKKPIPFDEVIERESKLLESLNFYDINHFVEYENSKAYLYGNKLGKEILTYINEMED